MDGPSAFSYPFPKMPEQGKEQTMNKISVVKRMAWLSVATLAFVFGQQAKAQTPPSPPFTVLMYYDGSPEFAVAHTEALAGFATDPDYLPVTETSDPAVFTGMLSIDANSDCNSFSHPYDVFFAITTDGVTATSWNALSGQVGFNSNYASIYLDPISGTISAHLVTSLSIPNADPIPSGAPPCFFPSLTDITGEIIGNPSEPLIVSSESVNSLSTATIGSASGGGIIPDFDQWLKDFNDWVKRNTDKVRAKIGAIYDDVANFLDSLGPDTHVDLVLEVQAAAPVPFQNSHVKMTITIKDVPITKVAELERKLGDLVKPGQ